MNKVWSLLARSELQKKGQREFFRAKKLVVLFFTPYIHNIRVHYRVIALFFLLFVRS